MPEGWEATGLLNIFRESEQALARTVIYGNGVCCFLMTMSTVTIK